MTSQPEIIILLNNFINLKKLKETILVEKQFKIISFDYSTHKMLLENSIPHITSDTYLEPSDIEKLQNISHTMSKWALNNSISKELEYEGVNIGHLFYRDFQHALLPVIKIFYEIFKIFQLSKNSSYIVSSSLFEYVKIFSNEIKKIDDENIESHSLLNQSIKYQFNFGNKTFSLKLSRSNYRLIKNISEKIIHKFFGSKKNSSFTNVLLAEFDPIKYQQFFLQSKNSKISLSLYNRRRPSIWNKKSYTIIKNSNSQILSPLMLNTSSLNSNTKNAFSYFEKNIKNILNNKIFFKNYFSLDGISFWLLVKPILNEFFKQRLKEYLNEIEIAKGIFKNTVFNSLLIQNESGFTEQILINFARKKNIPIFLISHGLSYETLNPRYRERRIFDGVDPILSSKYLVWGQTQFLFAKNYGIDEKKLKIIGSPSHDMLFKKNKLKFAHDYVLLATSSPTVSMMKDLTIDTLEKYEYVIKEICKIVTKNAKNLIIKLHPFQEELDITDLVKSVDSDIKIIKTGDIIELIQNCSVFLTIDISTTMLDAQIFSKPSISISVKNYNWGIPKIFESNSCICTDIDNFEESFLKIQTNSDLKITMQNNGKKFVDDYLSYQGNSSLQLLNFLETQNNIVSDKE